MGETAEWLGLYLKRAVEEAEVQPLHGVAAGGRLRNPVLSDIYVDQQVSTAGGVMSAVDALLTGEEPLLLVVAGPGGGKTSLLRTVLGRAAGRWVSNDFGCPLPVRVAAPTLAQALTGGGLGHALAAMVNTSRTLLPPVPEAFFMSSPRAGGRWLVMVDGLDEVTDPVARMDILTDLAWLARDPAGSMYRFVIATRPLPPDELGVLGDVPRMGLLPFSADDLESVAANWFRIRQRQDSRLAMQQWDPDAAAREFSAAITRGGLGSLPSEPLFAALLCQVYARDPRQPLPRSRSQICRHFTDHLLSELTRPGEFVRNYFVDYHRTVAAQAEDTIKNLSEVIRYVASERFHGENGENKKILDIVLLQPGAQRPDGIPDYSYRVWEDFLHNSLCRSGVLVDEGGELKFLHPVIEEYLAARYTAQDPDASKREFRDIFGRWSHGGLRQPYKLWLPRRLNWSYVQFLVEEWKTRPELKLTKALRRLARKGGLPGWLFIALVTEWSPDLDGRAIQDAVIRCVMLVRNTAADPVDRWWAARALIELNPATGIREMENLAYDPGVPSLERERAVEVLAYSRHPAAGLGADPNMAPLFAYSWTAQSQAGDPDRAKTLAVGNRRTGLSLIGLLICLCCSLTAATTIVYPHVADDVAGGICVLSVLFWVRRHFRR